MFNFSRAIVILSCFSGAPVLAKSPVVVTDIAPVFSIVAQVMDGVGTPDLIVEPSSSPHNYSLRPSQAKALQNADVVIAVSEELTPWLVDSLHNLAKEAQIVMLADTPETILLEAREDDHDEDEGHEEESHDDDHDDHGHDHGDHDPHSWLDPVNAANWATEIAGILSEKDPENASVYAENAQRFRAELEAVTVEIKDRLELVDSKDYLVYHDAFQYFENRFQVPSFAAISNTEATSPGPKKISEIRELVAKSDIHCLVAEPGYQDGLVQAIAPDQALKVAELDPLGSLLPLDKHLYAKSLEAIAASLEACLAP